MKIETINIFYTPCTGNHMLRYGCRICIRVTYRGTQSNFKVMRSLSIVQHSICKGVNFKWQATNWAIATLEFVKASNRDVGDEIIQSNTDGSAFAMDIEFNHKDERQAFIHQMQPSPFRLNGKELSKILCLFCQDIASNNDFLT